MHRRWLFNCVMVFAGTHKSETAILAEHAKSAQEDTLAVQLARVYDIFHEIRDAWYGRR